MLHDLPIKWILIIGYLLALLFQKGRPKKIGRGFLWTTFLLHTLILGLLWYTLRRPPVSNMGETLLYVPWTTVLFGLLFAKKLKYAVPLAALVPLIFLPDPLTFSPLPPVLHAPYWLVVHVLMIVGSYGLFFLTALLSHFYLLRKNPSPSLEKTLMQTLYLGTALLIVGTLLGGMWAQVSWGRFWDWDPKESWAFISIGFYLILIHAYRFKHISGRGVASGSLIGLILISFTWYGVNYILGTGLHSYGFGSGGIFLYLLYILGEIGFLTFANKNYKKSLIEKKGGK